MNLPDVELVSAKVHEAWIRSKLEAGVTSRCSETGEELMVPYPDLSEPAKVLDRNTVLAVYTAIGDLGESEDTLSEALFRIGDHVHQAEARLDLAQSLITKLAELTADR